MRIATNLYATATPEGELVWTGISDSFNPSSAKKAIDAVVKVVVKDLEKEGILRCTADYDLHIESVGHKLAGKWNSIDNLFGCAIL